MKKNYDLWVHSHPTLKKLIMELKIATLLILLSVSSVLANPTYSQVAKVSLDMENRSLEQVMDEIESQSEFYFIFNQKQIDVNRIVNIQAENELITDLLPELFKGTNVNYVVLDRKILLTTDALENSAIANAAKTELQQKVVTGKITDTKGGTLPGVNVSLKGTTTGAIADMDGKYSIAVPEGNATLVFSFIGYTSQEIAVNGNSTIDVKLSEELTVLNEVVVTALGIKKEAKRIGYSTATVNNENITTNRTINVGNSLEGKVAGLNISAPAGGPGGSSKIRIRGQSSFGGNNSPLIIVNGVPINNTAISAGGSAGNGTGNPTGGSSDQGDGLQSINQDDIETMTVLKGAAAAALYGYRAKDGAIIITTKSGSGKQGIGIEINSNFQADQALDYTDFQYIYGQGENGLRPTTVAEAQSSGVFSFGQKFDGVPTPQFDGSTQPYLPNKNRIKDFYRTGSNLTNSLALTGQNDKGNFRLSFANTDAQAIIPNSDYHKRILNLGLNYKFIPQLTLQLNFNYSNEFNHNPPQIGLQDMNANSTIYTMANSIDVHWLKNTYKDPNGNEQPLSRFTNRNNPYWVAYQRFENVHRDRLFGNVSLRYQLLKWLYVQGRVGQDYFTRPYNYDRPTGTRSIGAAASGFNGYYYQDASTFRELNMDFLIGANQTFGDFGVDFTLGGNQMQQTNDNIGSSVTNFYVRDLYTIGNGQTKNPFYNYSKKEVNSIYGSAEFSYKNYLYLNLTARNDWFSTLNPKSNNYLYPSASMSYIFTQSFGNVPAWLNYGKVRASYAEVGGDTDPYSNNLYYSVNANQFNGNALGAISGAVSPNPNLRPLKVKEAEVGLELRTLDSRVNLDVAFYKKNTVDEILKVDISNASGFSQTLVNVGKLENKGIELLLTLVPVKGENITWETGFNSSYNASKVIALANGQQRFDVGTGEFFGFVSQEVGMPLASLRGFDYKRDANGKIITVGGLFQQGNIVTFGSAIPKWVGGWLNTVTYKHIRLFAQVDYKAGFKIMSNSNLNFLREGLTQSSLVGREGGVIFDGVNADGTPNTTAVPAQQFYTQYRSTNIATPFIYDGSFARLRSLSIGYDLSRFVTKASIREMTVSAVCNNVWLISKHIDNLDPEASVSTSDNLQGIETHTLPTTRSYGFNINIKF
jgi:TonB-linked SusC/RagA family outer membrane protein